MSQEAQNQAQAQLDSIYEMVAALEVDYDRLEELADERKPFAANWSLIGCMPDNDALTFEDAEDARELIVEELEERAEQAEEQAENLKENTPKPTAFDAGWHHIAGCEENAKRYREAAEHFAKSEDYFIVVNGWHFWIVQDENEGLTPDEFKEYRELKEQAGECTSREDAEQRIQEDALSVEVRSDWYTMGGADGAKPLEFKILLCTGGPHVEIRGELDEHGEPVRAWLVSNDWFESMQERVNQAGDQDALLTYARCFYFGE